MKRNLLIILTICVSVFSCKKIIDSASSINNEEVKVEDLKIVNVNDNYSMAIPKYMSEMKSLNDDASLEYANIFKETYTIVIDEDKEEFINTFQELEIYKDSLSALENYSSFQINSIQESLEKADNKELMTGIRNYDSKQFECSGKSEGINVKYLISFIEGKDDMYMIMSWTKKNKFKNYENVFNLSHSSFKIK